LLPDQKEARKGLETRGYTPTPAIIISAGQAFPGLTVKIQEEKLSNTYERDLLSVNELFIEYLKSNKLDKIPLGGAATEKQIMHYFLPALMTL